MQLVFELRAEVGAFETFSEEITLQRLVLKVLPDVGETLLPVLQDLDDVKQDPLHLAGLFRSVYRICHGSVPHSSKNQSDATGSAAGRDSPSPTARERNRENLPPRSSQGEQPCATKNGCRRLPTSWMQNAALGVAHGAG